MPPYISGTYRNPDFRPDFICRSEDVVGLASRLIQHASAAQSELHCLTQHQEIPSAFRGHIKSVVEILEKVNPIERELPLFLVKYYSDKLVKNMKKQMGNLSKTIQTQSQD